MDDRAVSDVVSYVLIFSMVSVTVGVVSVAGVASLQDVRDVEQVSNTERAFEVLADNLEDLHREGAPTRATEISLANGGLSTTSEATINVSGWNTNGNLLFSTGNVTSDVIRWRATGDNPEELAYEFGAVIRSSLSGGIVTRQGPFNFDSDRTIIPIVQTRATNPSQRGEGIVRVRGARSLPSIVHRGSTTLDSLWLNMTTDHGTAWQHYLDTSPGTDCTLEQAGVRDRLECSLDPVPGELYITIHPINVELER
jgi:hypothetical protein